MRRPAGSPKATAAHREDAVPAGRARAFTGRWRAPRDSRPRRRTTGRAEQHRTTPGQLPYQERRESRGAAARGPWRAPSSRRETPPAAASRAGMPARRRRQRPHAVTPPRACEQVRRGTPRGSTPRGLRPARRCRGGAPPPAVCRDRPAGATSRTRSWSRSACSRPSSASGSGPGRAGARPRGASVTAAFRRSPRIRRRLGGARCTRRAPPRGRPRRRGRPGRPVRPSPRSRCRRCPGNRS